MGYINRFLLFLYALAVALAALGVIVLCLPVFPVPAILNEAAFLLSRWETIAGAALVFLISVHLVACSLTCGSQSGEKKAKKEPEAVVVRGASGEVRVAIPAVSSLAEKSASKVYGVENVEAKVEARSLCTFDTLCTVASEAGYIQPGDVARLLRFRDNPSDESWIHS